VASSKTRTFVTYFFLVKNNIITDKDLKSSRRFQYQYSMKSDLVVYERQLHLNLEKGLTEEKVCNGPFKEIMHENRFLFSCIT